jgi:hypothetical protein
MLVRKLGRTLGGLTNCGSYSIVGKRVREEDKPYASSMSYPPYTNEQFTSTWTSKLDPKIPLSLLSIPGTHDAATYSVSNILDASFSSQTQSWNILAQLKVGIRFLDIRVKYNKAG